ncbi:MAG: acylneuraminate cytidylyltransferase family protein [Gammaproteobacteria bacterium]|nr:acylneuraminate cytidylyltransferase family protein [Gammaproteobacteria bacterium]MCI0591340.1 acylneuraminate cytidylyltransferase family protein [Gammaproteobacteria bacterium]
MKNLAPLAGRPLIDYCVAAGRATKCISRLMCSTDSDVIAMHCRQLGVENHPRPVELGADDIPLFDVIVQLLEDVTEREGAVAELLALLQPTSPFILPEHVEQCVRGLNNNVDAASAQTLIPCPHNHHAYNQRVIKDGWVAFCFPDERRSAYNKQSKPRHFLFGNVVVFRIKTALEQGTVFAEPSLAYEVPPIFGFDCDGPEDFRIGELLLKSALVQLPHL